MLLNALDFADLTAAIAAASDGDRIYLPGVKRWRAPAGGWQITKSLQIFGDGPGDPGTRIGTVLEPAALGSDVFVLTPPAGANALGPVYLHDLMIANREAVTPDGKNAINIPLAPSQTLHSLRLERVAVINMSLEGLYLSSVARLTMKKVTVGACHSCGLQLDSVGLAHLTSCSVGNNIDRGLECYYSASAIVTTNVENNPQSGMAFYGCPIAVANACRFEDAAPPQQFVKCDLIDCQGSASVVGSYFTTGIAQAPNPPFTTIGIRTDSHCDAITIFPNLMTRPNPTMIAFAEINRGCTVWPQRQDSGGINQNAKILLPIQPQDPTNPFQPVDQRPNGWLLADPTIGLASNDVADTVAGIVVPSLIALPPKNDIPVGVVLYRPPHAPLLPGLPIETDPQWGLRLVINNQWRRIEYM